MIHAYDKLYLEKARTSLARMLDFAVCDLGYDIDIFFEMFISSGTSSLFAEGDVNTLVGKSGVELTYSVLEKCGITDKRITPEYSQERSKEYWAGWALAYYQWETSIPFSDIVRYISISDIRSMYDPYHEMDIRQLSDHLNSILNDLKTETNLKSLRNNSGLSQKELAVLSGVPLRTIQQYEQRQKNINKAQAEYLIKLAQALSCAPSDLIERI